MWSERYSGSHGTTNMTSAQFEETLPTDEELIEQGFEPEEDIEAKAQKIADGLEEANISE